MNKNTIGLGLRKSLWIAPLLAVSLFSAELTEEEITQEKLELEAATQIAEEAKSEIKTAKAKLAEAEKRIKKVEQQSEDARYTTKTEFSYSNTQGNTRTDKFALGFHGERKRKKNTMTLDVDVLQSTSNGVEDNNRWLSVFQYDRDIIKGLYFNYVVSYGEDKFSGFDYQFYTGPGLGYKVLESDAHTLNVRANALYAKDSIENGGTNEYAAWLAGFKYKWQILDNLSFVEDAHFKSQADHFENYFIYSKTSIESQINGTFSLGLSYQVDYKNIPAFERQRTDRVFLATLIINY
jgi:putative salt-induced outer membrane protein